MSIDNLSHITTLISQGVYVISVKDKEQSNAFTAAWVMQVSFNPPLLCFSINPHHHSYTLLKEGKICCISVLNDEQFVEAAHFGQSAHPDKMKDFQWLDTQTGSPALAESVAYFDCEISHFADAGDHQLAVCKIIDAKILSDEPPMLYISTHDMDNSSALYKD